MSIPHHTDTTFPEAVAIYPNLAVNVNLILLLLLPFIVHDCVFPAEVTSTKPSELLIPPAYEDVTCFFIVNSSQLRDRLFASSSTKRVSSRRQLGTFASNVPFALGMPAFLIAPARIEPRTLSKAFFFILSYSLIGNALLVVVDGFNLAQPEIDS